MTEKRFVNIAKEPIFIVVNDTFEDEVLADDDVVDCLNELSDKNGQLEKENEQLKDALNQITEQCDKYYKENKHLKKEKESWKSNACNQSSFNSILLNELSIAQKQGYEVSDPFKKLMGEKE